MHLVRKLIFLSVFSAASCASMEIQDLETSLEDYSSQKCKLTEENKNAMYDKFLGIRGLENENYIPNVHDCDDMAQEFRDFLADIGIQHSSMRLMRGFRRSEQNKKAPGHMWLELLENGKWKVYDPSQGRFGEIPIIMRLEYKIEGIEPGDSIFKDYCPGTRTAGYQNYGDKFENGEWVRTR